MRELWLPTKSIKGLSPQWTKTPLKLNAQDKPAAALKSFLREKTEPKKSLSKEPHKWNNAHICRLESADLRKLQVPAA